MCQCKDSIQHRVQRCERRVILEVFRKSRLLGHGGLAIGSLIPLILPFVGVALVVARFISATRALIVALAVVEVIFDSHEGLISSH